MDIHSFTDFAERDLNFTLHNPKTNKSSALTISLGATVLELCEKIAFTEKGRSKGPVNGRVGEHICLWVVIEGVFHLVMGEYGSKVKLCDPCIAKYDPLFVSDDGVPKKVPFKDYRYHTVEDRFRGLHLLEGTTSPVLEYLSYPEFMETNMDDSLTEGQWESGIVRKYWMLLDSPKWFSDTEFLKEHSSHRRFVTHIDDRARNREDSRFTKGVLLLKPDVSPLLMVYSNQIVRETRVDIVALYRDFPLGEFSAASGGKGKGMGSNIAQVPLIRLYTDDYLSASQRIFTPSIHADGYREEPSCCVSQRMFERCKVRTAKPNGYNIPMAYQSKNTLTFYVFSKERNYDSYCMVCLHVTGLLQMFFKKDAMSFETRMPNDAWFRSMIHYVNEAICPWINTQKLSLPRSTKIHPMVAEPTTLNISYTLAVTDFKPRVLRTLVSNEYTEFSVITFRQEGWIYYKRTSGSKNLTYADQFLSRLDRAKVDDVDRKRLLRERFSVDTKASEDIYSDWESRSKTHKLGVQVDEPEVSIILQKQVDSITVTVLGATSWIEVSRVMRSIISLLALYQKKVSGQPLNASESQCVTMDATTRSERRSYGKDAPTLFEDLPLSDDPLDTQETGVAILHDDDPINDDPINDDIDGDEPNDNFWEYQPMDSQSSDSDMSASAKRAGAGPGEDSLFKNNRYYSSRLEGKDPELFAFPATDTGPTYHRKCTSHNQPLVLTKDELRDINESIKSNYDGAYPDIGYKDYAIYERNPDIVYLCPEYWDRKNQFIYPRKGTGVKGDPPDTRNPYEKNKPLEDIVYDATHTSSDRFVLHRDKQATGKYEVVFYHDVHPSGFPVPCCGTKPLTDTFKLGMQGFVNVLTIQEGVPASWTKGKIVGKIDSDNMFMVNMVEDNRKEKVHISRLEKYRERGGGLTQICPLPVKGKGHVSHILKSIFHMGSDQPNLSDPHLNGFYREGVQQDTESILHSINFLVGHGIGARNRSLSSFKKSLLRTIKGDPGKPDAYIDDVRRLLGGNFVTMFKTVASGSSGVRGGYSLYSLDTFIDKVHDDSKVSPTLPISKVWLSLEKRLKSKDNVKTVLRELCGQVSGGSERVNLKPRELSVLRNRGLNILEKFKVESAICNFKSYLEDTKFSKISDIPFWISLIQEIARLEKSPLFGDNSFNLNIIVCDEVDDRVRVILPLIPCNTGVTHIAMIYKKGGVCEPLVYSDLKTPYAFLEGGNEDTTDFQVGMHCAIDDLPDGLATTGEIKEIVGDIVTMVATDIPDIIHRSLNDCKRYDVAHCFRDIQAAFVHDIPESASTNEPLSYKKVQELIHTLNEHEPMKREYRLLHNYGYYTDACYRISHVVYQDIRGPKGDNIIVIPIKPEILKGKTLRMATELPKMPYKRFKNFYKMFMDISPEAKIAYTEGTLLLDDEQRMTHYLFANGQMVPLLHDPVTLDRVTYKGINVDETTLYNQSISVEAEYTEGGDTAEHSEEYSVYRETVSILLAIRDKPDFQTDLGKIVCHPLLLGIKKRQKVEIKLSRESGNPLAIKRVVEILMNHTWSKDMSEDTISFPPLPLAHASRNHTHTSEFSQREIENDNHLHLFQGVNPWIRNVDLYDVPLTHPPRNRFIREEEDTVTIDTSYPRSLRTYFGAPKLYTHINNDKDYTTDLYSLEWGINVPHIKGQLNTYLTQGNGMVEDPRPITVEDLATISSSLYKTGNSIGFAIYTNRYTATATAYELYLAIGPPPETSEDIQIVCVYQDHPNPLKNIVFAQGARSQSLKELRTNSPAFEKVLHREYANFQEL